MRLASLDLRNWFARSALAGSTLVCALAAGVVVLYLSAPKGVPFPRRVDCLLVLGTPAGMHGELTEMQRWRTDEAVREFHRGRAPHILFTGGPTFHGYVESDVMSSYAEQQGVPAKAILRERHALTTVQNIAFSAKILEAHGWRSVEVISTREHLPRAAVLLEKTGLLWSTHPVPTPDRGWADTTVAFCEEALGTAAIRVFGLRAEPVLHTLARGQHGLAYGVRYILFRLQDGLSEIQDRWKTRGSRAR